MRAKLKVGAIYHWLGYEDDELSRPMITSIEYLGLDVLQTDPKPDGPRHFFRIMGSDEKLMFAADNLPDLADVPRLIEKLREFQTRKHRLPPDER